MIDERKIREAIEIIAKDLLDSTSISENVANVEGKIVNTGSSVFDYSQVSETPSEGETSEDKEDNYPLCYYKEVEYSGDVSTSIYESILNNTLHFFPLLLRETTLILYSNKLYFIVIPNAQNIKIDFSIIDGERVGVFTKTNTNATFTTYNIGTTLEFSSKFVIIGLGCDETTKIKITVTGSCKIQKPFTENKVKIDYDILPQTSQKGLLKVVADTSELDYFKQFVNLSLLHKFSDIFYTPYNDEYFTDFEIPFEYIEQSGNLIRAVKVRGLHNTIPNPSFEITTEDNVANWEISGFTVVDETREEYTEYYDPYHGKKNLVMCDRHSVLLSDYFTRVNDKVFFVDRLRYVSGCSLSGIMLLHLYNTNKDYLDTITVLSGELTEHTDWIIHELDFSEYFPSAQIKTDTAFYKLEYQVDLYSETEEGGTRLYEVDAFYHGNNDDLVASGYYSGLLFDTETPISRTVNVLVNEKSVFTFADDLIEETFNIEKDNDYCVLVNTYNLNNSLLDKSFVFLTTSGKEIPLNFSAKASEGLPGIINIQITGEWNTLDNLQAPTFYEVTCVKGGNQTFQVPIEDLNNSTITLSIHEIDGAMQTNFWYWFTVKAKNAWCESAPYIPPGSSVGVISGYAIDPEGGGTSSEEWVFNDELSPDTEDPSHIFYTSFSWKDGKIMVYINGVLQSTSDYEETPEENKITFDFEVPSGSLVTATYIKA